MECIIPYGWKNYPGSVDITYGYFFGTNGGSIFLWGIHFFYGGIHFFYGEIHGDPFSFWGHPWGIHFWENQISQMFHYPSQLYRPYDNCRALWQNTWSRFGFLTNIKDPESSNILKWMSKNADFRRFSADFIYVILLSQHEYQ